MERLAGWVRGNAHLVLTYLVLLLAAGLLGLSTAALDPAARAFAADLAGFLGILALSVPTVRINEQAREVHRARLLVERARSGGEEDKERLARLEKLEAILAGRKGGWTRPVHFALYAGYVLVFSSAVARLL